MSSKSVTSMNQLVLLVPGTRVFEGKMFPATFVYVFVLSSPSYFTNLLSLTSTHWPVPPEDTPRLQLHWRISFSPFGLFLGTHTRSESRTHPYPTTKSLTFLRSYRSLVPPTLPTSLYRLSVGHGRTYRAPSHTPHPSHSRPEWLPVVWRKTEHKCFRWNERYSLPNRAPSPLYHLRHSSLPRHHTETSPRLPTRLPYFLLFWVLAEGLKHQLVYPGPTVVKDSTPSDPTRWPIPILVVKINSVLFYLHGLVGGKGEETERHTKTHKDTQTHTHRESK